MQELGGGGALRGVTHQHLVEEAVQSRRDLKTRPWHFYLEDAEPLSSQLTTYVYGRNVGFASFTQNKATKNPNKVIVRLKLFHLLWILELGRRHVPYPAHRLQRRLVEERRLAVHHLHYHDAFNLINSDINKMRLQ